MDAQEAGGDPNPREGPEHLARADDRWPDLLEDGGASQFRRRCFLQCPFGSKAPEGCGAGQGEAEPRASLQTSPSPPAAWEWLWGRDGSGKVSLRPSGFAASNLGPPRTSPLGILSVCPSLGLSVDGVPPGSSVVGFSLVGFGVAPPGQEAVPALHTSSWPQ